MPGSTLRPTVGVFALAVALALSADVRASDRAPVEEPSAEMMAAGFMGAHPDLRYRSYGVKRFRDGDYAQAFVRFMRAARFADKPSQGMIGEMYWTGQGVAQDRALAYAWMDLAAEREWRPFVIKRELYWAGLDSAERERAIEEGKRLYAEYGDDVAKPRKERVMERARRNVVGSRTGGLSGSITIEIPGPGGSQFVSAKEYYDDQYWKADTYWTWQERIWKEARPALVEVGPVSTPAGDAAQDDANRDDTDGTP